MNTILPNNNKVLYEDFEYENIEKEAQLMVAEEEKGTKKLNTLKIIREAVFIVFLVAMSIFMLAASTFLLNKYLTPDIERFLGYTAMFIIGLFICIAGLKLITFCIEIFQNVLGAIVLIIIFSGLVYVIMAAFG